MSGDKPRTDEREGFIPIPFKHIVMEWEQLKVERDSLRTELEQTKKERDAETLRADEANTRYTKVCAEAEQLRAALRTRLRVDFNRIDKGGRIPARIPDGHEPAWWLERRVTLFDGEGTSCLGVVEEIGHTGGFVYVVPERGTFHVKQAASDQERRRRRLDDPDVARRIREAKAEMSHEDADRVAGIGPEELPDFLRECSA